ncbi:MAG: hypothetical protein ACLQRH_09140 [Acidimicrobiales bacterium]
MNGTRDTTSASGGQVAGRTAKARWGRPDVRRMLQLALATVWLLDGVLQLQPFMFTPGSNGFSGMLGGLAAGNPHFVAHSITWNASIIDHHAVATNTAFAFIQILIGLGMAWRPAVTPALAASIVWALGVWWFGEALGGVLHGAGTPVGGGPGAVLFYALLAVLLWPIDRSDSWPFVAARAVGLKIARAIWVAVWAGLGVLALLGSGRSPEGLHDLIESLDSGQPGWLSGIDRHAESLVANHGLAVAIVVALICVVVALGVFLPPAGARATLILAIVTAAVIWVVGENFGMILAGGATDPNSGPVVILLALSYWPLKPASGRPHAPSPGVVTLAEVL